MLEVEKKLNKFRNICFGFYKTKTIFESAEKTNFQTKLSMHRLLLGHNLNFGIFIVDCKVKVKVKAAPFFLK